MKNSYKIYETKENLVDVMIINISIQKFQLVQNVTNSVNIAVEEDSLNR